MSVLSEQAHSHQSVDRPNDGAYGHSANQQSVRGPGRIAGFAIEIVDERGGNALVGGRQAPGLQIRGAAQASVNRVGRAARVCFRAYGLCGPKRRPPGGSIHCFDFIKFCNDPSVAEDWRVKRSWLMKTLHQLVPSFRFPFLCPEAPSATCRREPDRQTLSSAFFREPTPCMFRLFEC